MTAAPTELYATGLQQVSTALRTQQGGLRTEPDCVTAEHDWLLRYDDGTAINLELQRWCAPLTPGDDSLLDRCNAPTLDIGCGPGRLVVALAQRGVPALGIDITRGAVELARGSGAIVVQRCVFDPVPGGGRWPLALLADGNIGIGGNPVTLLARVRTLLAPGGRVLCELDPPQAPTRSVRVRIEDGHDSDSVSSWFPWAHVGADGVATTATAAGLFCDEVWSAAGRWFAALVREPPQQRCAASAQPRTVIE